MRPIKAIISQDALAHNLRVARQHARAAKLFSVVKANAYGHGLSRAVRALAASDGFAVLTLDEAANLRLMGVEQPILLLEGPFQPDELALCAELKVWPVIHRAQQLDWLQQRPPAQALRIFLKFNSGMHRLGFALHAFDATLARARALAAVADITLMTHFAQADEAVGIARPLQAFQAHAQPTGLAISTANSATLLRYPEALGQWARPGIMLYGASPYADVSATELGLRHAMQLESAIIAVQTVRAGDAVGYGQLFRAERDTRIGIVAAGYADGYPRHAPTGTPVNVDGRRTRTLGRVSMDMLYVDLATLPDADVGSRVVLWGDGVPVEDVALAAGTVSYELLCALAARVPVVEG